VPDLPDPFAETATDPALQALIAETLGEDLPSYAVVVHHLVNGRSAAVNEAQVYYAASLFKLSLLLTAYRQLDSGEVDFSQELVLEKRYVEQDLGTLDLLGLQEGDIITMADAVRAMIIVSDTPTAIMIQDLLGPARVEQMLQSLGLSETNYTTELPTSARDVARLLEAIASGEGVSEASRRDMLSLLLGERIGLGIPEGIPEGTPVAHKTGNWSNATHDAALVWGKGGPYIIVILSDKAWEWDLTVAVSGAIYDYFVENPSP
jgi:beta-lactamase class A